MFSTKSLFYHSVFYCKRVQTHTNTLMFTIHHVFIRFLSNFVVCFFSTSSRYFIFLLYSHIKLYETYENTFEQNICFFCWCVAYTKKINESCIKTKCNNCCCWTTFVIVFIIHVFVILNIGHAITSSWIYSKKKKTLRESIYVNCEHKYSDIYLEISS